MIENFTWDQFSFLIVTTTLLTIGFLRTYGIFEKNVKKISKPPNSEPVVLRQKKTPSKKYENIKHAFFSYFSYDSSVLFVGFISETYLYGGRLIVNIAAILIGFLVTFFFIQPLMYDLGSQIKTPYEYLQKRYKNGKICRIAAALIAVLFKISFSTLFLWSNATILHTIFPQIELRACILILGFLSLVFSFMGGLSQSLLVNGVAFFIFLAGIAAGLALTIAKSGRTPSEMWQIAKEHGRTNFIEPAGGLNVRYTVWNQLFSLPIPWCTFNGLYVPNFNRYRSIKGKLNSRLFVLSNVPIMLVVNLILVFSGVFAFSYFSDCDPIASSKVTNKNQIASYWLVSILSENAPGLAGICLASLVAYGAWHHSVGISMVTNTFLGDVIDPIIKMKFSKLNQKAKFIITVVVTVLMSSLSTLYSISFQYARNSVLSLFFVFNNSLNSPLLGFFFLAMFNPYSNFFGAVVSFLLMCAFNIWLSLGAVVFSYPKSQEFPPILNGCNFTTNYEQPSTHYYPEDPGLYYLYTISSVWYCIFSLGFVLIFGSILSIIYSLITKQRIDYDASNKKEREKFLFSFSRNYSDFKSNPNERTNNYSMRSRL